MGNDSPAQTSQTEMAAGDFPNLSLKDALDVIESLKAELSEAHGELAQTNQELLQLTLEFEDRVEERTRELSNSHEKLKREVEDRKAAQEKLTESENYYRSLIAKLHEDIMVIDRDYRVVDINNSFLQTYGVSREEAIGSNCYKIAAGHPGPCWKHGADCRVEQVFSSGESCQCIVKQKRRNGKELYLDVILSPLMDDSGEVIQVIEAVRDITPLIHAQEEVALQEEKYRNLVETSPDSIILFDMDGIIKFANKSAGMLFNGGSAEDLIGQSYFDLVPLPDRTLSQKRVDELSQGKSIPFREHRVRTLDGRDVEAESSGIAFDYRGRTLIQTIIRDITKRKAGERKLKKALEDSRARRREVSALLEGAEALLSQKQFDAAAKGLFDSCCKAIGATAGYVALINEETGENEVLFLESGGRECTVDPELPMPIRGLREVAYQKMQPVVENDFFESRWMEFIPPGHARLDNVLFAPLIMENQAVGLIGLANKPGGFTDEDKKLAAGFGEFASLALSQSLADAKLKESEERFRSLYNDAPSAYFSVSAINGRIMRSNKAAQQMLGFSAEDLTGRKYSELFVDTPAGKTRAQALFEKFLAGEPINDEEIQLMRSDKKAIWGSLQVTPIFNKEGKVVESRSVIIDIAERKNLEGQLRQAQKMEAIGTLAGGIAHDFNNILTPIMGYSELLLSETPREHMNYRMLEQIAKASRRARQLVHQILTFSRQTVEESKPLALNPAVKEPIKLLRASLPASIEIREHITSQDIIVLADPVQVHQITMNLCTNAAHAMPQGGILEVKLEKTVIEYGDDSGLPGGDYACLTISDTGTGISPEIIDRIFEPYFTTKPTGKGTGLGLSIIHGIVKNMGGSITVRTEPGQGSSFRVLLPLYEEETTDQNSMKPALVEGSGSILFVDDEEMIVEMVCYRLSRWGFKVTGLSDCRQALELMENDPHSFDLVITDLSMPHMEGTEVAQRIRKLNPDVPIILSTGYSRDLTEEELEGFGIDALILKPVLDQELIALINRLLAEKNASGDF